ncbi:hypothetical protein [Allokutzneria multivorans]|uniref:hypothetical protein n=1 Tax=Allokutzneria multivorans TaxID=1142134 RepID=UPI0031E6B7BA
MSINDVKTLLVDLAERAAGTAARVDAVRESRSAALEEVTTTWTGSRHSAAVTGRGQLADAVADLAELPEQLHRVSELLRDVATGT